MDESPEIGGGSTEGIDSDGRDALHIFDSNDASWKSSSFGASNLILGVWWESRRLTRWEWVKVRVLRRRDPRDRTTVFYDGPSSYDGDGLKIKVTMDPSGVMRVEQVEP